MNNKQKYQVCKIHTVCDPTIDPNVSIVLSDGKQRFLQMSGNLLGFKMGKKNKVFEERDEVNTP